MTERLLILAILLASSVLHLLSWHTGHNWGDDFSAYIMQAISLTEGTAEGFLERNAFTVNESSTPVGPVTYPWGFPILLAPFYSLFGLNILAFKSVVLIFYLGFLVVLWFLVRCFRPTERLIFVSIFAFNPYFMQFGNNVLSDIPFLFFSTLSFLLLSILDRCRTTGGTYTIAVLLGICYTVATAIRTSGILLPATCCAMLFLILGRSFLPAHRVLDSQLIVLSDLRTDKKFPYVMSLVCFSVTIWLFNHLVPGHQSSYLDHFEHVTAKSIFENTTYYALLIKDFFGPSLIGTGLYLFSLPFAFLGFREKWRNSIAVLIYVFSTSALYIIWPYPQGLRFIFPVLPFYIYFVFIGLRTSEVWCMRQKITAQLPSLALLSILVLMSIVQIHRNISRNFIYSDGPYTKDAQEMFAFIRQVVPRDEIVVFCKPRAMRLFTGRDTVLYDNVDDFKYLHWYVVDKNNLQSIDKERVFLFAKHPATIAYENSQFLVYKFK